MSIKHRLYKWIKNDGLALAAAFILAAILIVILFIFSDSFAQDSAIRNLLTSISGTLVIAILGALTIGIKSIAINHFEDSEKLTTDYAEVVRMYLPDKQIEQEEDPPKEEGSTRASFVTYDNTKKASANFAKLKRREGGLFLNKTPRGLEYPVFPIIVEHEFKPDTEKEPHVGKGTKLQVIDTLAMYEPPITIRSYYREILGAHEESDIHNSLVVRIRDWQQLSNHFVMLTERSTYYHSLVTNRAMDYDIGGMSVRSLLEYGPTISPLSESQLSNHLGFNVLLVTNDGYVPFIKRGRRLSLAKGVYGHFVAATLKAPSDVNHRTVEITGDYIVGEIKRAICDVLFDSKGEQVIKLTDLDNHAGPDNPASPNKYELRIIAAYRDLVEGGKPQLLVIAKASRSCIDICKELGKGAVAERKTRENGDFKIKVKVKPRDKKSECEVFFESFDEKEAGKQGETANNNSEITVKAEPKGKKKEKWTIYWVHKDDLQKASISPRALYCSKRRIPMLPDGTASVVMAIKSNFGEFSNQLVESSTKPNPK